ncbi:hypothetical protein Xen7305DRAFT_00052300 [Xenococcus sp. PCC 7305]|uniref:DUF6737 family protein n=1 Tax=Xenococcus sp. PCC 7305 TaxID=102125 RepID=UPI0002ABEA10|nr:DUF6737 family protein [Xenococcus sp. PCC 7305]ELS05484.1 hypothetical protein Xen7305DRAFT_00052300 [Xenococcus sp. PCC 7305]
MASQKPDSNLESNEFNLWNFKPWWCQPWSIILTGVVIIAASWLVLKILWLTILVAIPILLWWFYFLVKYPQLAKEAYSSSQISEIR